MRKTSFLRTRMDSKQNKIAILSRTRAGRVRLACEVNRNGGQQKEPAEVIQRSRNATLNKVGIHRFSKGRKSIK